MVRNRPIRVPRKSAPPAARRVFGTFATEVGSPPPRGVQLAPPSVVRTTVCFAVALSVMPAKKLVPDAASAETTNAALENGAEVAVQVSPPSPLL